MERAKVPSLLLPLQANSSSSFLSISSSSSSLHGVCQSDGGRREARGALYSTLLSTTTTAPRRRRITYTWWWWVGGGAARQARKGKEIELRRLLSKSRKLLPTRERKGILWKAGEGKNMTFICLCQDATHSLGASVFSYLF